jgi:hypothetical protein
MDKIKKYKILALSGWLIVLLGIIFFFIEVFILKTTTNLSISLKENIIASVKSEINNLGSLMIGKVSKSDIIKYYEESAGKKIDQEIDGVIYFDALGYQFNEKGILIKIFLSIANYGQIIPRKETWKETR